MKMKRFVLSPFFSPVAALIALGGLIAFAYILRALIGVYDTNENLVLEVGSYLGYMFSFIAFFVFAKDHLQSPRKYSFCAVVFLWIITLLREMGAQHWLTKTDTTAIKMRFFTNPNNPLSEKVTVFIILAILIAVVSYLLVKHFRQMVTGFFKLKPFYWSLATFGGLGIVTQFADRFPSRYVKWYGTELPEPVVFCSKLIEEAGEMLLPYLVVVMLWQCHLLIQRNEPISVVK